MSDTKKCAYCGCVFARRAGEKDFYWNKKKNCSKACGDKAWWRRNKLIRRPPVVEPTGRRPVTEQEVRQFADLIKSGMRPVPAAKQLGRTHYGALNYKAVLMGLLPAKGAKSQPEQPEPAPKINRTFPLPKGSALTWGEMMPDISWAEAERMTAQMRVY